MTRYEFSENHGEAMTVYSPEFLAKQPTICVGQADEEAQADD